MSALNKDTRLQFSNSDKSVPQIGFGVYRSPPQVTTNSVLLALKHGYRHIDSAQFYHNEAEVGEAVRQSGLKREEVFVTTKIWSSHGSLEAAYKSAKESVDKLGLGYADLILIHSPTGGPKGRKDMWQALERLVDEGLVKSIGVSNYGVKHLKELKEYARHPIAVNQLELHPWHQQREIVTYCEQNNILLEAYAPLVQAKRLDDPTLISIAKKHGVPPGNVLVRWSLQRGFIPLPKSDREERIKQNIEVYGFELDEEDMSRLNVLNMGDDGEGAVCWYVVNSP